MVTNRQQFNWRDWQIAPQLVVDYRVDRRKRIFPTRNVKFQDLLAIDCISKNDLYKEGLKALLWDPVNERYFDLAGFQKRSLDRILSTTGETATVVTAGTGSGKTLSFYLPALLEVSGLIDDSNWVKALAVYPRTELLKDQFMEAFKLARRLDKLLKSYGKRKIRIGAYFGSTPTTAKAVPNFWKKQGKNVICPWFSCPNVIVNLSGTQDTILKMWKNFRVHQKAVILKQIRMK